jgi:hypothetical protein
MEVHPRGRWPRIRLVGAWTMLVGALAGPAPARTTDTTILILGGGLAGQENRLVDASRIYTRDLDGRLVLAGTAPGAPEPRVISNLVDTARREGAEFVVWGARRADGHPMWCCR